MVCGGGGGGVRACVLVLKLNLKLNLTHAFVYYVSSDVISFWVFVDYIILFLKRNINVIYSGVLLISSIFT